MKKENSSNQKKNNNFLAAAVSLILSAALFAIDLFLLLNQPRNLIGLIGTTLLMLVWVYFFVRSVFQEMEQNKQEMTSYLEAMLKSEKAFFLMQRKVLNEMQQFGEDSKLPSEEIITAQKAIAKVTINKSRENTDALMNSNNQLLDRLANFEDKLSSFHMDMPETVMASDNGMENSVRDILTEQRAIIENMQRMEAAIKDEVSKAVNRINEMQSKMPVYVQQPVRQEEMPVSENFGASEEIPANDIIGASEEIPADVNIGASEEIPADVNIGASEEIPADVNIGASEEIPTGDIGASEEIPAGDIGASEEIPADVNIGASEEIPADNNIGASEEIPTGDIGASEEIPANGDFGGLEDIIIDNDIDGMNMPKPPTNENTSPAPEEEELPDLDALLSSIEDLGISAETPEIIPEPIAEPEPEPEPIPEPEPEPVEEKPTMPDLSNPNKMMTPDEIAALLANM